MTKQLKKYETIGCCGIDCGLCPRYHTTGSSRCPGCGGLDFREKHPSCGFLTCCSIKNGLEVCSECREYPCQRFDSGFDRFDSFVSHQKVLINLGFIKDNGMTLFLENQHQRMNLLNLLVSQFDDGRSKSFFCISCTLLPTEQLNEIQAFAGNINLESDRKEKSRMLKNFITKIADGMNVDLKLKKGNNFSPCFQESRGRFRQVIQETDFR